MSFVKKLREIEKAFQAITDLREVLERGDSMERLAMKAKALERQVADLDVRKGALASAVAELEANHRKTMARIGKTQDSRIAELDKAIEDKTLETRAHVAKLADEFLYFEKASAKRTAVLKRAEQEAREMVEKAEKSRQRMAERLSA